LVLGEPQKFTLRTKARVTTTTGWWSTSTSQNVKTGNMLQQSGFELLWLGAVCIYMQIN
jgi:hypothetical protein